MSSNGAPPMVYDKHEAAVILKVTVSWLERKAAAREIPFTMLSGSYKFTQEHLATIIAIFEQRPSTKEPLPVQPTSKQHGQRIGSATHRQATRPQGVTLLRPRPLKPKQASAA